MKNTRNKKKVSRITKDGKIDGRSMRGSKWPYLVNLRISDEHANEIYQIAEERKISVSSVIRNAISNEISR